ncbi:MAG TPA: hypothetical protein VFI41_04575 [Gemmatimonadales bacterium]|nr:hypothetical protein [Gemmatimonadales bacterium]
MADYAVYGVHFYGTAQYGLPPSFEFSLDYFDAKPSKYDRIKIEWGHPSGAWDRMRLVRGNYGFPTEYDDGRVLLEITDPATDPGSYEDINVSELHFHYYTMWLRVTADGRWVRAGNALALMPKNYGYTERLYDLTPGIFRDEDIFISASSGVGMLQTFLGIFGYQLDQMRSEIESLRWTADPERLSGGLLPYLADMLGFPYEAELGMELVRKQLLNAVYLYKMKGSRLGLEGAVKVLTGFTPVIVSATPGHVDISLLGDRVNLIENPSAETDASWWTGTNAAIARDTTQHQYGAASFRLTAAAGGDMYMTSPTGLAGMPVTPGLLYSGTAGVFKASGTARSVRTDILWYDAAGTQLAGAAGTSQGTAVPQTLGAWAQPVVTAAAPAGAATAALRPTVVAAGAGENQYIDGVLFEQGAGGGYFDASTGSPISDYLWEGTAHLSPSHFYYRRAVKNSRLITRLPEFLPAGTTFTLLYAEPLV